MGIHYKVGIGALILAVFAGLSGGITALFFQINQYSHILTQYMSDGLLVGLIQTHARMMIFFTLQPALMFVFGSWFIPVFIGAKDFSFPFMNVMALICLGIGFCCNFAMFFCPGSYLFTLYSLSFWAIASILFSINVIITILNNRASGVNFLSLPVFVWMQGISAILLLSVASILLAVLTKDYWCYSSQLEWAIQKTIQNFFYPMVMIMIFPAFGILFHILNTCSVSKFTDVRKVYYWVASTALVLFLFWNRFTVSQEFWTFHSVINIQTLFSIGLYGVVLSLIICAVRQFIDGEKSWVTPVLWSLGAIFLFGIGWPYMGLTQTILQIHSCITYGVMFSVFAGFYFWMGKILGRQYAEFLGKLHFILMFTGICLTLNMVDIGQNTVLCGDICMGLSLFVFVLVILHALYKNIRPVANYWGKGAITNEWKLPSPMFVTVEQDK